MSLAMISSSPRRFSVFSNNHFAPRSGNCLTDAPKAARKSLMSNMVVSFFCAFRADFSFFFIIPLFRLSSEVFLLEGGVALGPRLPKLRKTKSHNSLCYWFRIEIYSIVMVLKHGILYWREHKRWQNTDQQNTNHCKNQSDH